MLTEINASQSGMAFLRFPEETDGPVAWAERTLRVRGVSARPEPGQTSFFAADFARQSAHPWLIGEVIPSQVFLSEPVTPQPVEHVPPNEQDFLNLHQSIMSDLSEGRFQKVVPVVAEQLEFAKPVGLVQFVSRLKANTGPQFSYGFEFNGEGLCGITPELLFRVRHGVLETMALAGTAGLDSPSLLENPKESLEHRLVIENLLSDLRPLGRVEVGKTCEKPFGRLKHLYTPIRVKLDRAVAFEDLCKRLHPTAALGGWPRAAAMRWQEAQSFHGARRRFGAPFGFVDGDEMICVVAIRGLQWQGQHAQIFTGCGVVEGSVAEQEWQELKLKREAIYRLLGLVQ